jgi:hypothetical protein
MSKRKDFEKKNNKDYLELSTVDSTVVNGAESPLSKLPVIPSPVLGTNAE